MITRFLNVKGLNVNSTSNLNSFKDKKDINKWAFNSMAYCVENKIIKGFQNELQPKMTSSVEQVITMLDRIAIKNNWIVKSKDIYVNGFLLPIDTKLTYENYANHTFVLRVVWNTTNDIEKLNKTLKYMLSSKFKDSDNQINKIIDIIIKSKQENEELRKKININEYQIEVVGNKNNTYIWFSPIK